MARARFFRSGARYVRFPDVYESPTFSQTVPSAARTLRTFAKVSTIPETYSSRESSLPICRSTS